MSRYSGPRLRIVRRLGDLPGLTRKTPKRNTPPGQHGQARRKLSQFAIRLQEKQKLRYNYGITERQLVRYVRQARRSKGSTGLALLQLLEMRLDNLVFRLGMAPTIPAARQLVNHGHVTVGGRVVSIPSYQCRPGEVIGVRNREASRQLVETNLHSPGLATVPRGLVLDRALLTGRIEAPIEREDVALQINELLVVEYYARRV